MDSNTEDIASLKHTVNNLIRAPPERKDDADLNRFNSARRSLRIWPVRGSSSRDIWQAAGEFIHTTLAIPASEVSEGDILDIRSARTSRKGSFVREEVIVIFKEPEIRDLVSSYARNLASCFDANRNPTAGLRTEVPFHLRSTFRMLEEHGRFLKSRYGNELKWHIKFDDIRKTFLLNVRLPGNTEWERISSQFVMDNSSAQENGKEHIRKYGKTTSESSQSAAGESL